ncbi:MAG: hypothetical protein ACTSV7_03335 [Candidatus Baldrarchaeia archaeon]
MKMCKISTEKRDEEIQKFLPFWARELLKILNEVERKRKHKT